MSTKTEISNLPSLSSEGGLSLYLAQIKKFPMLDAEEEYMLAKNWKETGNLKSAEKLVTSHLRLVAKIAMGYRGYGLPVSELVSEGNIGLMQAVKKFEKILLNFQRQALHAKSLGFIHPRKNDLVNFDSKLPQDFKKMLDFLEKFSN